MSNGGKVENSVHLHIGTVPGNYVNQVHHTINLGESCEVKMICLIYICVPIYQNEE